MPLFSAKALGNLDPAPWTNTTHRPSPTDIKTAQVPDPTWKWAWPEWKVNHDDGGDDGGWEYSFMFSKKFSWHGPRWWNSFVRRRAWIRKRVKRKAGFEAHDGEMLNPDYFTIRPSSEITRERSLSQASGSHRGSRVSLGEASNVDFDDDARRPVEDMDSLLIALRTSTIDRERIEAVDEYLKTGGEDLVHLQEKMHEIMALFVFQASRRVLLTRLTQVYEDAQTAMEKEPSPALTQKVEYLSAAIKHADEEVRKLEYWSDVKGMAEEGGSRRSMDLRKQPQDTNCQETDQSGPIRPSSS
jgi:hypothetical protein